MKGKIFLFCKNANQEVLVCNNYIFFFIPFYLLIGLLQKKKKGTK